MQEGSGMVINHLRTNTPSDVRCPRPERDRNVSDTSFRVAAHAHTDARVVRCAVTWVSVTHFRSRERRSSACV